MLTRLRALFLAGVGMFEGRNVGVFGLASKAYGVGGLRRDFGFVTGLGFLILIDA
jgi:hypothetical protein